MYEGLVHSLFFRFGDFQHLRTLICIYMYLYRWIYVSVYETILSMSFMSVVAILPFFLYHYVPIICKALRILHRLTRYIGHYLEFLPQVFVNGPGEQGSIPGRDISNTLNMVPDTA